MPVPPALQFGPLFEAVQQSRLFPDSKYFADAVPRHPPAEILRLFELAQPQGRAGLAAFVAAHFALPPAEHDAEKARPATLREHIADMWKRLERGPVAEAGSALEVPFRHVVPGGRFREIYYWDSYFSMLGLARGGRQDLVEEMVDLFAALIERFGHIPNGARSYYVTRSQPPMFYLMVELSRRRGDPRLLAAMRREHDFWMSGGRLVTLPGGAALNRYWDDSDRPRDESWIEDIELARRAGGPAARLWRDIRAGAESGWDFSSRWLADPMRLETIRTTRILPSCLNALLYGLEQAIGDAGDNGFARAAARRAEAMRRFNWNEEKGFFADHLLNNARVSRQPTAAMLFPLFVGLADGGMAARTIAATRRFLVAPGGLRTTIVESGQQWDAPNGWAPLQWIGCLALERYGDAALARDIADRWVGLVEGEYHRSGRMLEKYDIESGRAGGGGEYPVQEGFGWTNGVTLSLCERYAIPLHGD